MQTWNLEAHVAKKVTFLAPTLLATEIQFQIYTVSNAGLDEIAPLIADIEIIWLLLSDIKITTMFENYLFSGKHPVSNQRNILKR